MVNVVGVRFKSVGTTYYFDPVGLTIKENTAVIVETARGIEYGTVIIANRDVPDDHIVNPLKNVLRIATEEDRKKHDENKVKEKKAFVICQEKIVVHQLLMKLVGVEYTFDNNKIIFFFTADSRIDFRELVKDLAAIFKTRIELRQIGVRDEAKIIGGIGICGRELCCSTFLTTFEPVSVKMAKDQGITLNPSKISGACGRLKCCLKFEEEAYKDVLSRSPRHGALVKTPRGEGIVTYVSLLMERVKVKLSINNQEVLEEFPLADISILKNPTTESLDKSEENEEFQNLV